jgi:hypothetical protein
MSKGGGVVGSQASRQTRCVAISHNNANVLVLTPTIAGILPAILCTEARERAEEDSQS